MILSARKSRVAILGPVAPFRGGIAQHTTRLAEAMAAIAQVEVFSFSRLYPAWLYPGRFQAADSEMPEKASVTPHFILDSLNPGSWRQTTKRIVAGKPRCVIVPWWTFFLAPCLGAMVRALAARGVPVVFVCHNVVDHEAVWWKRRLSRWALEPGTSFVVHATEQRVELQRLLGPVRVTCVPPPLFDQFPPARGLLPRRAHLELLFYGFIRPYKGLQILLQAMTQLRDLDVRLSVVGEPWGTGEDYWRESISRAALDDRVELVPRYVTRADSAEYFGRADAVVLPYTSATGTAVAATAYRYRKPVIGSAVGGLKDIVQEGVTGLLVPPGNPAALAGAIRRFVMEGLPQAPAAIERLAKTMTWEHLAASTIEGVDWNGQP